MHLSTRGRPVGKSSRKGAFQNIGLEVIHRFLIYPPVPTVKLERRVTVCKGPTVGKLNSHTVIWVRREYLIIYQEGKKSTWTPEKFVGILSPRALVTQDGRGLVCQIAFSRQIHNVLLFDIENVPLLNSFNCVLNA